MLTRTALAIVSPNCTYQKFALFVLRQLDIGEARVGPPVTSLCQLQPHNSRPLLSASQRAQLPRRMFSLRRMFSTTDENMLHSRLQSLLQGRLRKIVRGKMFEVSSCDRWKRTCHETASHWTSLSCRLLCVLHLRTNVVARSTLRTQAWTTNLQERIRKRNGLSQQSFRSILRYSFFYKQIQTFCYL